MRVVIGSAFSTAANSPTQFITTEAPRIHDAQFQARVGNASVTYIGTDSTVSATNGWALSSKGSSFHWQNAYLKVTASVKGTQYWMASADTTTLVDYVFVMEN